MLVNFKSLPRRHTSGYAHGTASWLGCLRWDLPTVGGHYSLGWDPGIHSKVCWKKAFWLWIGSGQLPGDSPSSLSCHGLELWAKVNPFSLELLLSDCFHHNSKRKTQDSGIYNKTTQDVSRDGIFTVDKLGRYWSLSISFPIPE